VELLHELLPGARRIAVLVNPTNPAVAQNDIEESQVAARHLGLDIVVLKTATEGDIESSVATAVQQTAVSVALARSTLRRMTSADLVHTNGFEVAL
jgi:putative ABC transport system substrate-binding protein